MSTDLSRHVPGLAQKKGEPGAPRGFESRYPGHQPRQQVCGPPAHEVRMIYLLPITGSRGAVPAFIRFSATMQAVGSLLLLCFAMVQASAYISIFYVLLAAIGLCTAFGNLRLKNWARYSTLAFSALLVLLPFGMILVYAYLDKIAGDSGNPADADAMAYVVSFGIVLLVIALPMAVLGGFWLYYFNRRSVKRLFVNVESESS